MPLLRSTERVRRTKIRYDQLQGRHIALQHEALHDPLGCGVDHTHDTDQMLHGLPEGFPEIDIAPEGGVDDDATISVMIVYTPNAEVWALQNSSGIENVVSQSMSLAQEAMDNSDVGITLDLVYAGVVDYIESGNSFQNLQRLTSPSDGYMEEVHDLRDAYGADLVACLRARQMWAASRGLWIHLPGGLPSAFPSRVCNRRPTASSMPTRWGTTSVTCTAVISEITPQVQLAVCLSTPPGGAGPARTVPAMRPS